MTSTVVQEVRLPEPAELDSDGSNSEDRDARKRLLGEADSVGPKKRRKQSTPVRFPASLMLDDQAESEEEDAHPEGKPNSTPAESLQGHPTIKDENLNIEFCCQYCSQSFDGKATLDLHLECEHNLVTASQTPSESQSPGNHHTNVETINQLDQSINLVNVPNIDMKNLTSSWLSEQVQNQQSQQQNEEWSASIHMMPKLPGLPNFPGGLPQYLPLPPGFPLSDSSHRPNLGPTPMRIFNPDAYCDLCNKEFCNKYFLKTHKANKHGIYVDNQPVLDNTPAYPLGQIPTNCIKLEPIQKPENTARPITPIPCDVCQKRFLNEDSLRQHKQSVHADQDQTEDEKDRYQSPGAMEMLFKQEYGIEQEDSSFMPPPRHLSPQAIQQAKESGFNADRLRKLGVLNPDAFCEICCKEYCNKYFLRTHKFKRHGIIIQDNEKPPINPGSAATWHHVQTSPLNLIINESGSEYSDRSTDDHECNSCGIRFQTQALYESHQQRVHPDEESKNESEPDNLEQRSNNDSISEDLQKLQTMILQLNGLEKPPNCTICGKECDSKSSLRLHMIEHGVTEDPEDASREKSSTPLSSTFCDKDSSETKRPEDHKSDSLPPVPTTPTSNPERKSSSLTPTSSYCEICNKELCNKYFMKTHMQRMHGIEIENGAQIGGVICNICNKELCSKYFLRVHKHNTHGIIEEGSNLSTNKPETFDATSSEDAALKPEQLGDLNHRYFTHFTEVCPICNRRFRSIKWLKAHLQGDHGKLGVDKWKELEQQYQSKPNRLPGTSRVPPNLKIPNGFESQKQTDLTSLGNQVLSNLFGSSEDQSKTYRCSYCNFSTTVLPFLFLHERSHSNPQESENERILQCPLCPQSFSQPEMFHHHLLTRHQFPNLLTQFPPPIFNRLENFADKMSESKETDTEDPKVQNENSRGQNFEGSRLQNFEGSRVQNFESSRGSNNFTEISRGQGDFIEGARSQSSFSEGSRVLNNFTEGSRVQSNFTEGSRVQSNFTEGARGLNNFTEHSRGQNNFSESGRVQNNFSESPRVQNNLSETETKKADTAVQVTPQGVYKCAQCGFATANLNRIKKHIKKDHKAFGEPTESVISELSKILKEVANKHKVPASYAMPQDMNSNPEKTIMQPFLIEEQQFLPAQDCGGEESGNSKRFAPALVYLPVKARVSGSLTASFTLSPA